jgi:tripartite-type tricarboxylate transporter receptor subunit TctC
MTVSEPTTEPPDQGPPLTAISREHPTPPDHVRREWIACLACAALGGGLMAPARKALAQGAEPYPSRTIKLVTSYAAGNIADSLARLVAQKLSDLLKQAVVVENRPGQGGSLGAQGVAKAPADGYTLLFTAMAAIAINPHVYARVGYDPVRDFSPVTAVARTGAGVLYVNPELKVNSLGELIALSKAKPGFLNYGTAGSGTVPHLNTEALKAVTGLNATHIPYKGAAAVLNDVAGGQIHFAQESAGVVLPQLKSGRVKALVATGTERLAALPDLPAITEVVTGFNPIQPWMGILAPAGTPSARIALIDTALRSAIQEADFRERLVQLGLVPMGVGPEPFATLIRVDLERFAAMVKALKLQAD